MIDLRPDTADLWRAMSHMASRTGTPAVMFIAPTSGAGTTSVASAVALQAAARARRPAWLVDLDLTANQVHRAFQEAAIDGVGRPGRPYDAALGAPPIYELTPPPAPESPEARGAAKLLTAHQVEGANLFITRFRTDRLREGQRVRVRTEPRWWDALRRSADWIIVDAPATDRAAAGLVAAGQMDGVVLVVRADRTRADAVAGLRRDVEAHGGRVLGVVMNAERADARLAERLFG